MTNTSKVIHSVECVGMSTSANPRYKVIFTDDSVAFTQSNASINYGITDPELHGVLVEVDFSRHGRITDVRIDQKSGV